MVLVSTYPRYARLMITRGGKLDDLYNGSKGVHVKMLHFLVWLKMCQFDPETLFCVHFYVYNK